MCRSAKSILWGRISPRKWRPVPSYWLENLDTVKREPQSSYLEITAERTKDIEENMKELDYLDDSILSNSDLELSKPAKLRSKKSNKRIKAHRAARRNDCHFPPGPSMGKKLFTKPRNSRKIGAPRRRDLPQPRPQCYVPNKGCNNYLTASNIRGTTLGISLAELMLQLQDREITEEDYDLLLQLDSAVTSEPSEVRKRTGALTRWYSHSAEDELMMEGEMCIVCMCQYTAGIRSTDHIAH